MSHISRDDLTAFIDGDLTGDRAAEKSAIEEHLKSCEECEGLLIEEKKRAHLVSETISKLEIPEHILDSFPTPERIRELAKAEIEAPTVIPTQETGHARSPKDTWKPYLFPRRLILSPSLRWAAVIVLSVGGGWMMRGATMLPRPSPLMQAREFDAPMLYQGIILQNPEATTFSTVELSDGRQVEIIRQPAPARLSDSVPDQAGVEQVRAFYASYLPAGWSMHVLMDTVSGQTVILRGPVTEPELIELGELVVPEG